MQDKFAVSGLTALPGETVAAPRVAECPVQMRAKTRGGAWNRAAEDEVWRGRIAAIEIRVTRVHAHPAVMMEGEANRIAPDKWRR